MSCDDEEGLRQMPNGEREFFIDYRIAIGILFWGMVFGGVFLIVGIAFASKLHVL